MKKLMWLICALALICSTMSGCQGAARSSAAPSASVTADPQVREPDDSLEPQQDLSGIKPGTWMAYNGESGRYYFFNADGSSGCTADYENGAETAFTYTRSEEKMIFLMGDSDAALFACKVVVMDDAHIKLEWEEQDAETLTFLSALDAEHVHFYTNEELCEMALSDYMSKNDPDGEMIATAADNDDGTVTIQIDQNLSDHRSTAAWYWIDRCTGEGKDVNTGNQIDLTNGSPDVDITLLKPEASALPEDHYECIVTATQYSSQLLLSPMVPVTDLRVVLLDYTEDGSGQIGFRITDELFSVDSLAMDQPLVIQTELPEIIPYVGIAYTDRNGEAKLYGIAESGLDGAPLLVESSII